MAAQDIIFQLKKNASLIEFNDRFDDLIGKYSWLHDIQGPVKKYRSEHPEINDDHTDEELFTQRIYPEMSELEKKLYRTFITKNLDQGESEKIFNRLEESLKGENALIEYVQRPVIYEIPRTKISVPVPSNLTNWGIDFIGCREAWKISKGEDIIVAVIDTGVDYNHDFIKNNMWIEKQTGKHGKNFVNDKQEPFDSDGHGTHCAGIIAADNISCEIGVAPKAKIMALKIFDQQDASLEDGNTTDTQPCARAIKYAADNNARVLSNSWVATNAAVDKPLAEAIDFAISCNCVVVFAAGNNNDDVGNYFPANSERVISVTSIADTDERAPDSNWGNVTVVAPGVNITSLLLNTRSVISGSGTSMACPHVAGLAALILGVNKHFTPKDVRKIICDLADPITANPQPPEQWKLIDASKSVEHALNYMLSILS